MTTSDTGCRVLWVRPQLVDLVKILGKEKNEPLGSGIILRVSVKISESGSYLRECFEKLRLQERYAIVGVNGQEICVE